jgi:CheY-like chemotaxis protein
MSRPIMIVDDEAQIRALVKLMLKRQSLEAVEAPDGPAALEMLDFVLPSLFILDIMMPGMDGIELCQKLRSRPDTADIPVIIMSAIQDPRRIRSAMEAGANDFLPKGTPPSELTSKIRQLLETQQANAQ